MNNYYSLKKDDIYSKGVSVDCLCVDFLGQFQKRVFTIYLYNLNNLHLIVDYWNFYGEMYKTMDGKVLPIFHYRNFRIVAEKG